MAPEAALTRAFQTLDKATSVAFTFREADADDPAFRYDGSDFACWWTGDE